MIAWVKRIERSTYGPLQQAIRRGRLISPYQRNLSQTASRRVPRKGYEDKDSINTEATEYSKSGTDDQAAKQEEAAFDPSKTSPEAQKDKAGEGITGNPLEVSPANPEVSKTRPK